MKEYVDHLDEDTVISSQQYVCLSFLLPENIEPSIRKSTITHGVIVRGAFPTIDEAKEHVNKLNEKNSMLNIYIAPVGKWLSLGDCTEKELNDLMIAYKENQELSKKEIERRTKEAKEEAEAKNKKMKELISKGEIPEEEITVNEIPKESKKKIKKVVAEEKPKIPIETLCEDDEIPTQQYVCLSFLSPEKIDKSLLNKKTKKARGIKIRGLFEKLEDAKEFGLKLRKENPLFSVYVGKVGKLLPWDSSENAEEENYQEKELNDIVSAYKKNQELSKIEKEKREKELKDTESKSKKKKNKNLK
jgi:hypothetical protein